MKSIHTSCNSFISEAGGTQFADASKRPCLETLIDYWDGATNGVFVLDMPSDQPGGAVVKGNWREAELLNVSRPFVIKLLESGAMPYRKVGTHRRVRLVDVLEYRDKQDAVANAALEEMVRQAEEHGLYD